ncbi:zf-TFIIB domain-containing protein [Pseudoflavitalea rhizosphaerae]|uniref:TFIIB-type zinc ribbon-containing protein n=1 Tax=Pseudoflavitalea rhizosphaerae TaxID=1884793 RepID=UPI000F8C9CC7|nr:zf-TFIIB domain-containing protein [Pseudoflavitalea rhizosphaerae]
MKCPNCNETLLMTERNNIEIDYCPSCRGIWLDKGELDKMLEYAEQKYRSAEQGQNQNHQQQYQQPYKKYDNDHYKEHHKHNPYQKPYKKKGFLGDLFDFD